MNDSIPVAEIQKPEVYTNLATIQKIRSLEPIEGADKIELAKMEGLEWQVVVQKGLHKIGDSVCYIQIDTICPEAPWSEFLRDRHFRVRTIRLRKQLSQGLIVPLRDIYSGDNNPGLFQQAGTDITIDSGVIKYEKPIPANLRGKIRGSFPTHLCPKTDEPRIQNCSRILEELADVPVYITVKMDGTSATYINHNGDGHVCSRNMDLKGPEERTFHEQGEQQAEKPNVYWEIEQRYDILNKLKLKGNYAVQGEICGEGIQGNKIGLKGTDFFAFNVYNVDEHRYLNFHEFQLFCNELGLKMVPVLEYSVILTKRFDEVLLMADGQYPNGTPREGIVIRPTIEQTSEVLKGERASFKVVSNAFLLKYDE